MDMLQQYDSDSSSTLQGKQLGAREARQVYLVTYSQADAQKFPTRRSFAEAVVHSFSAHSAVVLQWCCAKELHRRSGMHYHVSIKLDKTQRWLPSKKILQEKHGISVHFSNVHANYYTVWKYVTKEDGEYEESDNHLDLSDSDGPVTTKAHEALQKRRNTSMVLNSSDKEEESASVEECNSDTEGKGSRRSVSAFDVSEVVIAKNLRDRTVLLAFANMQKRQGKIELAEFIINRGIKVVNEVISNAWEMENAERSTMHVSNGK